MEYTHKEIEERWQKYWAEKKTFAPKNDTSSPKYYVLDMFPYPSGAGLHVGHPLGYIASDIYSRYKRSQGFNVLHPMGYDSFGLPAEQYAIQTGQHPAVTTEQNIKRYREQLDKLGFSFDWDRQVKTSDPSYYKWTQWIFLQLFNSWYNKETDKAEAIETLIQKLETERSDWKTLSEKEKSDVLMEYRIAYLGEAFVNWCPALGTVLANDEVKDGVSERGGYPVERKLMKQWSMRITDYAERLLTGLDSIDWSESIKEAQRNWIGKSEGCSIRFHLSPDPSQQERGDKLPIVSDPMKEYYTTDGQMWNLLIDKAKSMRSNPTVAEAALWEVLRRNNIEYKIRRQHIINRFIVDFVCLSKMIVIEVDGDIHDYQKEEDESRTSVLNEKGFKVIRFRNEEVIANPDVVAEKILKELNATKNYPEAEKNIQTFKEGEEEYSIGRSQSPSPVERGWGEVIEVFTTRPDTLFGITFLTLAPEHELVSKITTEENKQAVEAYLNYAKNRSERERQADIKKITGQFTGAYAIHPFTGKQIPVWVGDYVLAGYGTGAVMAVPGGDQRDWSFAKHFGLPIIPVIEGSDIDKEANESKEGKMINSDFLDGLQVKEAIKKIIAEIEKRGLGKGKINYRLRDAAFGRQRYWGEPIPIYYKDGIPYAVDEKDLPVVLPEVDKFLPTEDGEPPMARAKDWKYKGQYDYESTTMPGWAGSSWYYLRYMDPHNDKEFVSKAVADYWSAIDFYLGGSEHATGHLLYVRFWTKFLKDRGFISIEEPARKLVNQGMIQGVSKLIYMWRLDIINAVINKVSPIYISYDLYSTLTPIEILEKVKKDLGLIISDEKTKEVFGNPLIGLPKIHVDVNLVNENDYLNIDKFKEWKQEFNAEFLSGDKGFKCGSEVEKMSKSKWNVVNPDELVEKFGADTLRMYEMFLGPLEQSKPWNTNGITGVSGFLKKFWRLYESHPQPFSKGEGSREPHTANDSLSFGEGRGEATKAELKVLHKTIKKITDDIEKLSLNTCVSTFMICVNELTDLKCNKREILEPLVVLVAPFAPHIAEELWNKFGHTESVTFAKWPEYKEEYTVENSFSYPVSFNGKTRFFQELDSALSKEDVEKEVMALEQTQKYLEGKQPKKVIVVHKKIVNIVV